MYQPLHRQIQRQVRDVFEALALNKSFQRFNCILRANLFDSPDQLIERKMIYAVYIAGSEGKGCKPVGHIFLDVSHGFRPKRSCHTALKQLRREFNGTRWFVEGDIKGCFDNINHAVLVGLLNSCLKTLASKHKTSLSKTIDKFNDGTGKWGIPYETKQGNKRRYFANYADCKGKGPATDYISNAAVVYGYAVNTLENRLKAKVCELCGTTESDHYEVHHINKLKNLKGKERWEIAMIAKHRKTLVVCRDCHRSIIHKK